MIAPWAEQPTPLVDRRAEMSNDNPLARQMIWGDARAIEQRMRAAEALLVEWQDARSARDFEVLYFAMAKTSVHLAAARDMDQSTKETNQ